MLETYEKKKVRLGILIISNETFELLEGPW